MLRAFTEENRLLQSSPYLLFYTLTALFFLSFLPRSPSRRTSPSVRSPIGSSQFRWGHPKKRGIS